MNVIASRPCHSALFASQPSTSGRCCQPAAVVVTPRRTRGALQQQQRQQCCAADAWRQRRRRGVAAAAAGGGKPDWLRALEESAPLDEDAARLLDGAGGDPDIVQQRMRQEQDSIYNRIMGTRYGGEEAPMKVRFRGPADTFSLWIWLELYRPPSGAEFETLQEVVNSWFLLGRLGGFNSSNLQVLYNQEGGLEDVQYDQDEQGAQLPATFHDMGELEVQGPWCRFWVDLGTADELALDVLVNALSTLSKEQLGVKRLVVGGENEDWTTPQREDYLPDVTMDPMRGPMRQFGMDFDEDDEDEDEDELGEEEWQP